MGAVRPEAKEANPPFLAGTLELTRRVELLTWRLRIACSTIELRQRRQSKYNMAGRHRSRRAASRQTNGDKGSS